MIVADNHFNFERLDVRSPPAEVFLLNRVWLIFTGLYLNTHMRQTSGICEFVPEDRSSAVGGCSYIGFINMVNEIELVIQLRK